MERARDGLPQFEALAGLEECRLRTAVPEVASATQPFAGGVMTRGEPGSWVNAAYGAGMSGAIDPGDVESLVRFYESAGLEPRIELCPFAEPTLVAAIADAQFVVRGFDQVLFRSLEELDPATPDARLEIAAVDPADDRAVDLFARTVVTGFLHEGAAPLEAHLVTARAVARHSRSTAIVAFLEGEPCGASALEIAGELAALFSGSVLPEFRRRGVQQAMFAWRLRAAAERGARYATVSGRPGGGTERNARRFGFAVAYSKAFLVRPRPGLMPVIE